MSRPLPRIDPEVRAQVAAEMMVVGLAIEQMVLTASDYVCEIEKRIYNNVWDEIKLQAYDRRYRNDEEGTAAWFNLYIGTTSYVSLSFETFTEPPLTRDGFELHWQREKLDVPYFLREFSVALEHHNFMEWLGRYPHGYPWIIPITTRTEGS